MTKQPASSIGNFGEISHNPSNDRIRCSMYDKIIYDKEDISELVNKSEIQGVNVSRISLRFICKNPIPQSVMNFILSKGFGVEAKIELDDSREGYQIVYIGKNDTKRQSESYELVREYQERIIKSLSKSHEQDYITTGEKFSEKNNGFSAGILRNPSEKDIEDIVGLYKGAFFNPTTKEVEYCFPLTTDTVKGMLSGDHNTVGYVKDNEGNIVSVGIGEGMQGHIYDKMGGTTKKLNIIEVSDTATKVVYDTSGKLIENLGGRGLNTRVVSEIIRQIGDNADTIFGETRSVLPSVNHLAIKTGRKHKGTLPGAVKINGLLPQNISPELSSIIRENQYGDLNVMAVDKDTIRRLYL